MPSISRYIINRGSWRLVVGASLSEPYLMLLLDKMYVYVCMVRHAISHFQLIFCAFLRHALIQNDSQINLFGLACILCSGGAPTFMY